MLLLRQQKDGNEVWRLRVYFLHFKAFLAKRKFLSGLKLGNRLF